MIRVFLLTTIIMCFTSCSWLEYFVVSNLSQSDLIVDYKLNEYEKDFPIFNNHPLLHKLNSSNEIDWNTQQIPIDEDTSQFGFKLTIPPHYMLVFGELSNDHYTSSYQYFINGRSFNLKELEIIQNHTAIKILPSSFDRYFKKRNGMINFEIK